MEPCFFPLSDQEENDVTIIVQYEIIKLLIEKEKKLHKNKVQ